MPVAESGAGAGQGVVLHPADPSTLLAHGIGSQHDLPISPFYAFAGAVAALFVSFLALGLLWSSSRFRANRSGLPLPAGLQRVADAPARDQWPAADGGVRASGVPDAASAAR
ncbi:hypothetical protein AB0D15_40865, partial [Streptomyces sp. NPDC048551]